MWQKVLDLIDVEAITTRAVEYLPNIVASVVIVIFFWMVLAALRRLLNVQMRRTAMPEGTRNLLLGLLKYTIVAIALLTVASQFKIKVTSMLAGLGVLGLAASLAAQDTLANAIAGITLVIDRPFRTGDWVELAGIHAHVQRIRLRTTSLITFDNQSIVVPNRLIAQERIINYTLVPRIRVRVPLGIAYKEDTHEARRVMLGTLAGDPDVLPEPAPDVVVTGLGASSVDLEMRFWIEDASRQFPKQWEYTEKCKHALDEADIEIPFPHLQLFLEQTAGLAQLTDSIARG